MSQLRIVSLVPSLTELVVALGRGASLVGRTRFCTEPAGEIAHVPIMGGTKNPVIDRIVRAEPWLVIANREENRRDDIEALEAAGLNVMLTDPNDVPGAIAMIRGIGVALDAEDAAGRLVTEIELALADAAGPSVARVFVPIWLDPLMAMGRATYGNDLLIRCGGENVVTTDRYPQISLEDVTELRPGRILLPDEPFPFSNTHLPLFRYIAPARVIDGKLLWWYGPRMPVAIRELSKLLREPIE